MARAVKCVQSRGEAFKPTLKNNPDTSNKKILLEAVQAYWTRIHWLNWIQNPPRGRSGFLNPDPLTQLNSDPQTHEMRNFACGNDISTTSFRFKVKSQVKIANIGESDLPVFAKTYYFHWISQENLNVRDLLILSFVGRACMRGPWRSTAWRRSCGRSTCPTWTPCWGWRRSACPPTSAPSETVPGTTASGPPTSGL